jgi:predicted ArsR family transcriptional regulator
MDPIIMRNALFFLSYPYKYHKAQSGEVILIQKSCCSATADQGEEVCHCNVFQSVCRQSNSSEESLFTPDDSCNYSTSSFYFLQK